MNTILEDLAIEEAKRIGVWCADPVLTQTARGAA